jgi:hypothetical protein
MEYRTWLYVLYAKFLADQLLIWTNHLISKRAYFGSSVQLKSTNYVAAAMWNMKHIIDYWHRLRSHGNNSTNQFGYPFFSVSAAAIVNKASTGVHFRRYPLRCFRYKIRELPFRLDPVVWKRTSVWKLAVLCRRSFSVRSLSSFLAHRPINLSKIAEKHDKTVLAAIR